MIRYLLLQNKQGRTRLSKWFVPYDSEAEKIRTEAEVHALIVARERRFSNFIEYSNYKLVYRRYAGLFFCIGCDLEDNELSYLEAIHLFVELLDGFFNNVCELDIVFNFNRVYTLLDEFILAGEVQETSRVTITDRMMELERLD